MGIAQQGKDRTEGHRDRHPAMLIIESRGTSLQSDAQFGIANTFFPSIKVAVH